MTKKEPINVTHKVPIRYAKRIDKLVSIKPGLGYQYRGEFINDAIKYFLPIKEKELIEKMKMDEYFKIREV
jgi:hypothetical protein